MKYPKINPKTYLKIIPKIYIKKIPKTYIKVKPKTYLKIMSCLPTRLIANSSHLPAFSLIV